MPIPSTSRSAHRAALALGIACLASPALAAEPMAAPDEGVEEVTVTGSGLGEEQPVGSYGQPEWTTRRRFGDVDVYVQPAWQLEVTASWIYKDPLEAEGEDGKDEALNRFRQEFELGLPYRFQVDAELTEDVVDGEADFDSVGFELRWALADWGEIFGNPTLYAEYELANAASDEVELKAAVGDAVVPGLYTALNFFYDTKLDGGGEHEISVANAWSYSIIDRVLSLGGELRVTFEHPGDEEGARDEAEMDDGDVAERDREEEGYETLVAIGPSLQWRITDDLSLVVEPLFGVTEKAPDIESLVTLRWYPFDADADEEHPSTATPSMERD